MLFILKNFRSRFNGRAAPCGGGDKKRSDIDRRYWDLGSDSQRLYACLVQPNLLTIVRLQNVHSPIETLHSTRISHSILGCLFSFVLALNLHVCPSKKKHFPIICNSFRLMYNKGFSIEQKRSTFKSARMVFHSFNHIWNTVWHTFWMASIHEFIVKWTNTKASKHTYIEVKKKPLIIITYYSVSYRR